MALPLRLRNRLAGLVLAGFSDPGAREALRALAAVCGAPGAARSAVSRGAVPVDLLEWDGSDLRLRGSLAAHADELCARARRAWGVLRDRELAPADGTLAHAMAQAGALFDARLYFEVHEHLEARWSLAAGRERIALQGLIQVAVAFEHLANGNAAGARQLLAEGAAKLDGQRLAGADLDPFARGARACGEMLAGKRPAEAHFDWMVVPAFPISAGASCPDSERKA